MPNTIHLHRVLTAPPARVYRAFIDPLALAKWLPPHGFVCQVHEFDARVGGAYRMSFTHFDSGRSHSFGGVFLELEPDRRICHTDQFADSNLPGEMKTTIELTPVFCGAELNITQAGIPDAIPPQACYLGWQESLSLLAQLVNAEVPAPPG